MVLTKVFPAQPIGPDHLNLLPNWVFSDIANDSGAFLERVRSPLHLLHL